MFQTENKEEEIHFWEIQNAEKELSCLKREVLSLNFDLISVFCFVSQERPKSEGRASQ